MTLRIGCLFAIAFAAIVAPAAQAQEPDGSASKGSAGAESASDDFEFDFDAYEDDEEDEEQSHDDDRDDSVDGFGQPGFEMEELRVVAKPQTSTNETDSSIGFGGRELQLEGISNVSDLANLTPNLEIKTAFAATNPTLFIRGVGLDDFNANSAGSVAVYQDGVYMNSPAGQLFQLFDVERIDVLRGPQGTLRNATAGAIVVRTNRPRPEFETNARVTYGRFNQVDVEGMINLPIVPERLDSRVAASFSRRDGITENRCKQLAQNPDLPSQLPCQDAVGQPLDEFVNDVGNWAVRGLLGGQASLGSTDLTWLLNAHGGRNDSDATQYQHRGWSVLPGTGGRLQPGRDQFNYQDTDGDFFAGDYDFQGSEVLDLAGASLTASLKTNSSVQLESITSFEWHDRTTEENTDANPRRWLETIYTDDSWQASEELWLDWEWGESGTSRFGGMVLFENLDSRNFFSNLRGVDTTFDQRMKQYTRAFAFYAESSWEPPVLEGRWDFLQNFVLDGGARFSWERKEFFISSNFLVSGGGSTESKPPASELGTWTGWSGFATVTYRITPSADVYAKYSRGWKPGHFNGGTIFSSQLVDPVEPETVDSFEAGLRTEWFDGLLNLDVTGFTYAYRNLQVFLVVQDSRGFTVPQLVNSERANVNGVELELHLTPVEGLQLDFAGAWLDSAYTDFGTTYDRRVPGNPPTVEQVEVDFSGNRLIASPVWSFSGAVSYTWVLDRWGSLQPRFSYSFRDDVFFGPNEGRGQKDRLPDGTLGQEAYWLLNAGLTWLSEDARFEAGFWVRNLLDQNYRVQSFDLTDPFRLTIDAYGSPRTFGMTLGVNFF